MRKKIIDESEVRKLYDRGWTDRQIAVAQKVNKRTICEWRSREKLPPNQALDSKREPGEADEQNQKLYDRGWTDRQIADFFGVSISAIAGWRWEKGLPTAWEATVQRLYDRGWSDREIANEVGSSRTTICSWRWRRGLPVNQQKS